MAVTQASVQQSTTKLGGLAKRLVNEGIVSHEAAAKGLKESKKHGTPFVLYLVKELSVSAKKNSCYCQPGFRHSAA